LFEQCFFRLVRARRRDHDDPDPARADRSVR
jgi:hypothetical protein